MLRVPQQRHVRAKVVLVRHAYVGMPEHERDRFARRASLQCQRSPGVAQPLGAHLDTTAFEPRSNLAAVGSRTERT